MAAHSFVRVATILFTDESARVFNRPCPGTQRRSRAFNPTNPPPLSNLYVSMLQRTGINVDRFGSSTGTLTGLESAG